MLFLTSSVLLLFKITKHEKTLKATCMTWIYRLENIY